MKDSQSQLNRIVSDGRDNLLKDPSTKAQIAEIQTRVKAKYEPELSKAGFFRKIIIHCRIEREIKREIEKIAPQRGLYLRINNGGGSEQLKVGDLKRNSPPSTILVLLAAVLVALCIGLGGVVGGWQLYVLGSVALVAAIVVTRFGSTLWILLIALLPFSIETNLPGTGTDLTLPTELLIPVLLVIATAGIFLRGKFSWTHNRLNAPVLLFALVILGSFLVSQDRWISFKAILRDEAYIVTGFLLIRYYLTSKMRLSTLLFGCALGTTLVTAYGLYTQFIEGVAIYQDIAQPFFKNHCIYAAFLAMNFAMLAAFYLAYPRSKLRWIAFLILGFWGFAIAMTFVRGAWLSLLALVVFYAYLERRLVNLKIVIAIAMLGLIGVGIVGSLQLAELFAERMEHLTDLSYVTNYDRIDRWMAALLMFWDYPLLGVGWGRYADEYYQYIYYLDTYSSQIRMGAHNLYLEILAESGVIGGVAFGILILLFVLEARRLRQHCSDLFLRTVLTGTLGAMLTYLVHAFVNNLGPSDKIGLFFWVLIGLVPVVGRLMEQSKQKTNESFSYRQNSRSGNSAGTVSTAGA